MAFLQVTIPVILEPDAGHTIFASSHNFPYMFIHASHMRSNYFSPLPPQIPLPGSIPAELGSLGALRILQLENNQLAGELCRAPYRKGLRVENP